MSSNLQGLLEKFVDVSVERNDKLSDAKVLEKNMRLLYGEIVQGAIAFATPVLNKHSYRQRGETRKFIGAVGSGGALFVNSEIPNMLFDVRIEVPHNQLDSGEYRHWHLSAYPTLHFDGKVYLLFSNKLLRSPAGNAIQLYQEESKLEKEFEDEVAKLNELMTAMLPEGPSGRPMKRKVQTPREIIGARRVEEGLYELELELVDVSSDQDRAWIAHALQVQTTRAK